MADEDFEKIIEAIKARLKNFQVDEQRNIKSWIEKLADDRRTEVRGDYLAYLNNVTLDGKTRIQFPFNVPPPSEELVPLKDIMKIMDSTSEAGSSKEHGQREKKKCLHFIPPKIPENTFVDSEEMARIIAESYNQPMNLQEFVSLISPHTIDNGKTLRAVEKQEMVAFESYIYRILTQRLSDVNDALAEEQNSEISKIKNNIEKWRQETSQCRRGLREFVPNFDIEEYKCDPEYLGKVFFVEEDGVYSNNDEFHEWREGSMSRLNWFSDEIKKIVKENAMISRNIDQLKLDATNMEIRENMKQQLGIQKINDLHLEIESLKEEKEKQTTVIQDLLLQREAKTAAKKVKPPPSDTIVSRTSIYTSRVASTTTPNK